MCRAQGEVAERAACVCPGASAAELRRRFVPSVAGVLGYFVHEREALELTPATVTASAGAEATLAFGGAAVGVALAAGLEVRQPASVEISRSIFTPWELRVGAHDPHRTLSPSD